MMNGISFRVSALDDFTRPMKKFEKSMGEVSKSFEGLGSVGNSSLGALGGAISDTYDKIKKYKAESAAIKNSFIELGQSTDQYIGKTDDFMGALKNLGKQKKKLKDNFVANNEIMKMSFFESIGSMLARSTQSSKIADNLERIDNPLYNVNQSLLKVTDGLEGIAKKGSPAVLALKQLGPTANMKELNDQVRLINQGLLRMTAVGLVAGVGFIASTALMIDRAYELNDALGPLTEKAKSLWSTAFDPLARVVGKIAEGFFTFTNGVASLINRFNEANPVMATALQTFGWLTIGLTALLAPLAIGIGLTGGLTAAFSALWMVISPFVVGLATVIGTAALVAAAIVGLGTALYLAYTKLDWFKNAVDTAWAWIKNSFFTALDFIKGKLTEVMSAITAFGGEQLGKFQALWSEHGAAIMTFVKNAFNGIVADIKIAMAVIETIFRTVWPLIEGIVKIAWNLMKTTIGSAIDIIVGLIDVGMSLLQGDWKGAWNAIKGISENIMGNIIGFFESIDLFQIGKDMISGLVKGIGSMAGAVADKVRGIANAIPSGVKKLLGIHSPSRVMMELGGFTAEGMALGIGKGLSNIQNAAGAMARAAVPGTSGASLNYGMAGPSSGSIASSSNSSQVYSAPRQPVILQVNLEGRTVAEQIYDDINTLLSGDFRREARNNGFKF
jgi:phage-related protein